jgi:hypothetical protein
MLRSLSLTTVPESLLGQPDGVCGHGHPQSFQVAVTVVLEQLKREELKKQRKKN